MKEKRKKGAKIIVDEKLSRKEWLEKAGKYSVFTAATMMMILHPTNAAAQDSAAAKPPEWQ
jgi:hypothetical protein